MFFLIKGYLLFSVLKGLYPNSYIASYL